MKDPIVEEIHRYRQEYAKRLDYDVRAIGDDIRRCEAAAAGAFTRTDYWSGPPLKPLRRVGEARAAYLKRKYGAG
jgi:hypothetical protein